MGASIKKFSDKYPHAAEAREASDKQMGLLVYDAQINRDVSFRCFFLDGWLYEMRILYSEDFVRKNDGVTIIFNQLIGKFGKGDVNKEDSDKISIFWKFPEVERYAEMMAFYKNHYIRVMVSDNATKSKLAARRKNAAKTGLED